MGFFSRMKKTREAKSRAREYYEKQYAKEIELATIKKSEERAKRRAEYSAMGPIEKAQYLKRRITSEEPKPEVSSQKRRRVMKKVRKKVGKIGGAQPGPKVSFGRGFGKDNNL